MPEIMTIEGLHLDGRKTMDRYEMPLIEDDMGLEAFSVEDLKEMALLAGTGLASIVLGDLTKVYDSAHAEYVRPAIRIGLGVAAYYGLRNWNADVAKVGAAVLVGSGVLQLIKPHLLPLLPAQAAALLSDIVVEDRLLSQLSPEERAYLSEVQAESPDLLPPSLSEVVQEDLQGSDDDDDALLLGDDEEAEEISFMDGPPALHGFDASWLGG